QALESCHRAGVGVDVKTHDHSFWIKGRFCGLGQKRWPATCRNIPARPSLWEGLLNNQNQVRVLFIVNYPLL
ncbi:MAG: hypothetical protein ACOYLK_12265, partial [Sphingomonas sp.]